MINLTQEEKNDATQRRAAEILAERRAGYGETSTTTNTVYQPYAVPYAVPVEKSVPVYDPTIRENIVIINNTMTALIKRVESLEKKVETLPLQRQFNSLAPQIQNLRKENQILSRQILWLKKIIK